VSDIETGLGLPYKPRTRQQQGRYSEKTQAKKHGVRLHPNSGAGRIKEDASDETRVVEFKDASKSFTLNGADLLGTFQRAVRQGKDSVWIITFANGVEATITLNRKGGL
jgi:hypothetical protein